MAQQLTIEIKTLEDATVIKFGGDLTTLSDQYVVTDAVQSSLEQGGRRFIFDLSGLLQLSSHGLAAFMASYAKVAKLNGEIRLVKPAPAIERVIAAAKLAEFFPVYISLDAALTARAPLEDAAAVSSANTLSVSMLSTKENIARIIEMMNRCLDPLELPENASFDVRLATQEAVINAVEHGNLWDETKHVHLYCEVTSDRFKMTVRDEGPGFKPCDVPDPTLPENILKEHGRGIFLMRNLCDEISYSDKGNEITIIKKFRK